MVTRDALKELVTADPRPLLISVHALTDPRDPANGGSPPGWMIALRNELARTSGQLEAADDRDARLAFRALRDRIERELADLGPGGRGRSVSWFVDPEGYSERFILQVPLRGTRVVADSTPFVSPLVDVVDRGAPAGVILASGELVRLVHIEQAEATEPAQSSYELSLGDWRQFGGTAGGSPARGLQPTSHRERYEARVEAQRDRLFETAATATAKRIETLGWERVVLVCERQIASRFRAGLPAEIGERVIAEADLNLVGADLATIADGVQPTIEAQWHESVVRLVELANQRALAGGRATLGAEETLGALAEGRVDHLILDPDHRFSVSTDGGRVEMAGSGEMLAERAVEAAISSAAQVSALSTSASETLRLAGGMVALLRH